MLLRDGISTWLVAFYCRKFFATCCLLRHSGLFGFIFWPVGNDRTDELVQKVADLYGLIPVVLAILLRGGYLRH